MKHIFFIEGYRAKTDFNYEDTLTLSDQNSYESEEQATAKAYEYLEKDSELGMIIIYKGPELGEKTGIKFIHRDQDGELVEVNSWWATCPTCA